jgi:hypothetical protein
MLTKERGRHLEGHILQRNRGPRVTSHLAPRFHGLTFNCVCWAGMITQANTDPQ